MAKIFLDSNILIDFLVEERGALNLAAVKLFENFSVDDTICYSFGSISDVTYVLKKCYKISDEIILDFFGALSRTSNFKCLSLSSDGLLLACEYAKSELKSGRKIDFEDILQYFCALEGGCEAIVTNDKNLSKATNNLKAHGRQSFGLRAETKKLKGHENGKRKHRYAQSLRPGYGARDPRVHHL